MKKLFILLSFCLATVAWSAPPQYLCWNGAVVKNPKHCPKKPIQIVCPDGRIVTDAVECVGPPICPDGGCTDPYVPM